MIPTDYVRREASPKIAPIVRFKDIIVLALLFTLQESPRITNDTASPVLSRARRPPQADSHTLVATPWTCGILDFRSVEMTVCACSLGIFGSWFGRMELQRWSPFMVSSMGFHGFGLHGGRPGLHWRASRVSQARAV
jgi:hypothetical protein